MPKPPETDEGWYVLHDLRRVDWNAWRDAAVSERDRAIDEGRSFLEDAESLSVLEATSDGGDDPEDAGASACYVVLGHEADLMLLHLRPTLGDLDTLERQFEQTALAEFTERTASYVSVTEASGYTGAEDYFDPDAEADAGIRNYIQSRLYPDLPDAEFVSFYPMDKRRGPEYNWYDLDFEERAEYMSAHGDIGRDYAGRVSQIISGSVGLDDFEWGVTLFADDPTDVKELLYEMRFDPSTSRFAEFGSFYSGRRFPPSDLEALLAGERVPTGDAAGGSEQADETSDASDGEASLDTEIADVGANVTQSGHAVLVRSDADDEVLREEVESLRGNFEHYDSHEGTTVHETADGSAVVSVWETASAADTASGFLKELEGVTETVNGTVGDVAGEGGDHSSDGDSSSAGGPPHGHGDDGGSSPHEHGGAPHDVGGAISTAEGEDVRASLEAEGIYGGQPHGEDVYALVLYSRAALEELTEEVSDLADGFDRYDTHLGTDVYVTDDAENAVVSLWETADAASTASDYLSDLPDVVREAGEGEGFATMGMFYTVKPEHRETFVDHFADVGDLLAEMEGHGETHRYENVADENDMFIASRWASQEDATAFFRSDAFAETVQMGREILADRPRHVFLA